MSNIRTTELRKVIQMYEKHLALSIEEEEDKDEVRFVFTNVDAKEPETEFYFVLAGGLENNYESASLPPIYEH